MFVFFQLICTEGDKFKIGEGSWGTVWLVTAHKKDSPDTKYQKVVKIGRASFSQEGLKKEHLNNKAVWDGLQKLRTRNKISKQEYNRVMDTIQRTHFFVDHDFNMNCIVSNFYSHTNLYSFDQNDKVEYTKFGSDETKTAKIKRNNEDGTFDIEIKEQDSLGNMSPKIEKNILRGQLANVIVFNIFL